MKEKTKKTLKFVCNGILGVGFVGIGVAAMITEGPKKACVDNPKEAGKKIGSGIKKVASGLMSMVSGKKSAEDCGGVNIEDVVTSTSPMSQNNGNPHNNRNNGNWGSNRKFNN